MQKVLAEVTDHMEQQYSAHQYLERLRSDNEGVALKEKERVVRSFLISLQRTPSNLDPEMRPL